MTLWTMEHAVSLLPSLAVMLVIAAVLHAALRKKSFAIRMLPIQLLTCVLLLLEIGKQGVSLWRGYDLYHLPFHFCSLFIFVMPVMAFYRGKYMQAVHAITASISTAVFLLMMIYPNLIYSGHDVRNYFKDFMAMHTVTFHSIVVLIFLLMVALDLYRPKAKGESKPVIWFTVGFCVVAAAMAHLLKTNYANYYTCNIPILETVRQAVAQGIGIVPAQLLYVLIVSALNVLFVLGSYWLYRGIRRVITGKKAVCQS